MVNDSFFQRDPAVIDPAAVSPASKLDLIRTSREEFQDN